MPTSPSRCWPTWRARPTRGSACCWSRWSGTRTPSSGDVGLTEPEWQAGTDFLTRCGQITDDRRQRLNLVSDVLGLSMLTVAVNEPTGTAATQATVFGPFFLEASPRIDLDGAPVGGARGDTRSPTRRAATRPGA